MISLVLKDREAIVTMSHVSVEPTQVSYHTSQHITTQHPTFGQNKTILHDI